MYDFCKRLDPRLKLSYFFLVAIFILYIKELFLLLLLFFPLLFYFVFAANFKELVLFLKSISFVLLIINFFNFFSAVSFEKILLLNVKLIFMAMLVFILIKSTPVLSLSAAFEKVLKPFQKFKFPLNDFVLLITIAMHFIPFLVEDLKRIKNSYRARGIYFPSKRILQKLKFEFYLSLYTIVPFLLNSLKRATYISMSMQARCYIPGKDRTSYITFKFSKYDFIFLIVLFLQILVFLCYKMVAL